MWYMRDGTPAHFSRPVRDVLNNTYHDRWIGRGGPTAWPIRSPDFNPLDFYVWEHLKPLCMHLLLTSLVSFLSARVRDQISQSPDGGLAEKGLNEWCTCVANSFEEKSADELSRTNTKGHH
jgi:hypothetical protein